MKIDRYLLRGIALSAISLVLALYEVATSAEPRLELIFGYSLVFLFGVFTVTSRHRRKAEVDGDG